jgi:phosphoglycolate phosphatase
VIAAVRGLIFDLDGTLVDSRQDLTNAINAMRTGYALPPLTMEQVTSFIGNGARNLVRRAVANASVSVDEALAQFKQHYAQHLTDCTRCYPGVPETLAALVAAGYRCAVLTNKPAVATHAILRAFKLDALFNPVVGGDSTPVLKPDPHAFLLVAEQWQLPPHEVLVVGDNDTDVDGAHHAGMPCAFARYGFGTRGAHTPSFFLDSFSDLLRLPILSTAAGP